MARNGTGSPVTLAEAASAVAGLIGELVAIDRHLAELAASLPDPRFEEGTDEPTNPAGQLYGLIAGVRQDELAGLIAILRAAAEILPKTELNSFSLE